MKYSAVFVAALASGAMARAVPDVPSDAGAPANPLNDDPVVAGAPTVPEVGYTTTAPYKPAYTTEPPKYDNKPAPKYDSKPAPKYDSKPAPYVPPKVNSYDSGYKPSDYTTDDGSYKEPTPKYGETEYDLYKPVWQKTYEENKDAEKHYGPAPTEYKPKEECASKVYWSPNVEVNKPCHVEWTPAKPDYKKKYNVYLYRCDDYSSHKEVVCKGCDKSYDQWKPSNDCTPSDAKGSTTYRFKFCEEDDEDNFTWGCEFPIWNNDYFKGKEHERVPEQCPKPNLPPPCPTSYPTSTAVPYTPAPAETAAPAPVAPAPYTPPSNASAPAEAPVYTGASSTIRASFSAIVGVAALIAFAL
jgi:hypothetical protein